MVLAEALLRVPDATTADRLIEDKLATGDWSSQDVKSNAFLVSASAWTLGITARIIQPGETPDTILETPDQAARPAGGAHRDPAGDAAARLSFRARADHRGGARPRRRPSRLPLFLRHAGRGRPHGRRRRALSRRLCGRHRGHRARRPATARCPNRPGISVKLSALHPRFEAISRARVLAELVPDAARARPPGARP